MKGRIQCPNCSKQFIVEAKTGSKDIFVSCPFCQHTFHVKPSSKSNDSCDESSEPDDCTWEEYGEPRKTILSSTKPKTDKPMIASILLFIVVIIGIIASITPGLFLQTPIMIFSNAGVNGSIVMQLDEEIQNISFDQITLTLEENSKTYTGILENRTIYFHDLPLGSSNAELRLYTQTPVYTSLVDLHVIPFLSNTYEIEGSQHNNVSTFDVISPNLAWCSSILIILSVICLIGALSAWKRTYSDIAMIGCIVGIFTFGFFLCNLVLGIIAFYLLYSSRDEFDDGKKGKSF